jgi:hypothetical protein
MATRFTEPNIIHNPMTWFGVWTPTGWAVHEKRWGKASRHRLLLSGDGKTTAFPQVLHDTATNRAAWDDDLHVEDDSFTDGGIYPCDPRVEYPPGRPRWAISHTLMCHPVADHNLYTHQYTWDLASGSLNTYFRRHVVAEASRTDSHDGRTVRVTGMPISQAIEANRVWPLNCSAVRGVWTSESKNGKNLYARRVLQRLSAANGVYIRVPHTPVVQCWGIWRERPEDPVASLFNGDGGEAKSNHEAALALGIPYDCPRLGMIKPQYTKVFSPAYEREVLVAAQDVAAVEDEFLRRIRARVGAAYVEGQVGFGADGITGAWDSGYAGYDPTCDLNADGRIDDADLELCQQHLGRDVRVNLYRNAYFGGDWVSTGVLLENHHRGGAKVIVDYEYGAGYDPATGLIRLHETPGPDKPVWVEYFHDAPADVGQNNIVVHTYREHRQALVARPAP